MTRLFAATAAAALLLAACGGETAPAAPVEPTPPAETMPPETAAPDPTALPLPAAGPSGVAAMNMLCGGATFRVAFVDTHAEVINDDGTITNLPALAPDANAAPGVTTYTDGKMTFAKSGGGDTATVIRFARGRMAFEDCAIAQN